MKIKVLGLTALVGIAIFAIACSQPPTDAINAAKAALEAANAAEAGDYAPEAFAEAQTAQAALEAEVKAQEGKFALTRSYAKAAELAAAVKAASDKAVADAATGKEAMKAEVTGRIETVKASVASVKEMLAKAPKGKGSQADVEAMKSDLAGIEASFAEIETAIGAGTYKDAKAKLDAAQKGAALMKADIEAAIAAKAAAVKK